MPRDEARSTPLGPGLSFFGFPKPKTLKLNHVFKVTSVSLVPAFPQCRVWLGLSTGAHFTGIVGGGQSARACPGPALGTLELSGALPLHAAGRSLSKRRAEGEEHVEGSTESDKSVECSERLILECECSERLILLGLKEDWLSEQRAKFECGCGQILTLADRLNEEVLEFRRLMRGAFKVPGG
jgi:hypothetical protein